ncbi:sensor histidine kinase [Pedobacter duraquae]|uniref:Histidine kinase n=1 Tax=Pedobacter duraquae TaxID=425511 RepID=A0A4R6IPP0_9SPHI|nr:histidine kinase [Pedobacter duraquae]TDO24260.1 histidine kinase [Pedobacter duraquae]
MFKSYQIKWFFILTGILTISTLLLRQETISEYPYWQFINYGFQLAGSIFICWLIIGYFFLHKVNSLTIYSKFVISVLLSIIASFVAGYLFFTFLPPNVLATRVVLYDNLSDLKLHFTGSFFLSLVCYVVFYSTHTNAALQETKLENEILGQAHLRAQLISLQQQISPHFLFNSLSTLKTIATDQPTKNYVVQLATVYRYVLNFNEEYLTPLIDEINFIRSYLYIMNERFEDGLKVDIQVQEEHLKLFVPALSLQLLIENATKHNAISLEQPLHISIRTDNTPALIVENNFQPKKIKPEGTGNGLKNITERYKLLVKRPIEIIKNEHIFSVTIPLLQK